MLAYTYQTFVQIFLTSKGIIDAPIEISQRFKLLAIGSLPKTDLSHLFLLQQGIKGRRPAAKTLAATPLTRPCLFPQSI
jgi:hypothetical protein